MSYIYVPYNFNGGGNRKLALVLLVAWFVVFGGLLYWNMPDYTVRPATQADLEEFDALVAKINQPRYNMTDPVENHQDNINNKKDCWTKGSLQKQVDFVDKILHHKNEPPPELP